MRHWLPFVLALGAFAAGLWIRYSDRPDEPSVSEMGDDKKSELSMLQKWENAPVEFSTLFSSDKHPCPAPFLFYFPASPSTQDLLAKSRELAFQAVLARHSERSHILRVDQHVQFSGHICARFRIAVGLGHGNEINYQVYVADALSRLRRIKEIGYPD